MLKYGAKNTIMRKIILIIVVVVVSMLGLFIGYRFGESELEVLRDPGVYSISEKTTKITYQHHTNSGRAIYTAIQIFKDCLVWKYDEARNNCCLIDTCKYNGDEFNELIKKLAENQIASFGDCGISKLGGSGFSYSFEINSDIYLKYTNDSELYGDYKEVSTLINQFIELHKTDCQLLFEKLSKKPHECGDFGEFKTLPKELEKYSCK
jgi:hypothetical protein